MRPAIITATSIAVLALAACSGTPAASPTVTVTADAEPVPAVTTTVETMVTVTAEPEPPSAGAYETYLANNPDPSLVLSEQDALARATLGCGTDWPAGSIDAVLQDAYDIDC